ncbi:nucleotide exchange factor GrpE [Candidatus Woesearchaeota archaeon]|nr:nucleotide exchange factor GrpE [Candidatus Woesearchaeota archaeon]
MAKKKETKETKPDEKQELVEHLQRLQAEFDNYRKRTETELQNAKEQASDGFLGEFLGILDNMTLAIKHEKKGSELLKGILIIKDQMTTLLEEQGIKEIPEKGHFNPNLHEALMMEESKAKPNTIIKTIQRGYTRNGRVLRTAKVSVAK